MATVPVFAPDGTLGDIPQENLPAAVKAGGKMGVVMTAPDGTEGVIPADRVQEAVQAGGRLHPLQQDQPAAKPGLRTLGADLKSMLPSAASIARMGPNMYRTPAEQAQLDAQGQSRKAAGYSATYRAGARVAEGVGSNVPGMEQSAAQGDWLGVLGHALAVPLTLAATEGAGRGLPFLKNMVPSKTRAGANFQAVMGAAKDVPVDTAAPGNTALDIKDVASRGGRMPKVVNDYIRRVTDPNKGPLTYQEGRDFSSNAGQLSVDERNALKPNARRMVGQFARQLNESNAGAAAQVGKLDEYQSAMTEFRKAKSIEDLKNTARDLLQDELVKGAIKGAGIGAGGAIGYQLYKKTQ